MSLLQMLEHGLCLQTRLEGELLPNLIPNIRERIRSCSPRMLLSHLAWQAPIPQVLSRCLRVHARFRRRNF
jgi:hypothetical protein